MENITALKSFLRINQMNDQQIMDLAEKLGMSEAWVKDHLAYFKEEESVFQEQANAKLTQLEEDVVQLKADLEKSETLNNSLKEENENLKEGNESFLEETMNLREEIESLKDARQVESIDKESIDKEFRITQQYNNGGMHRILIETPQAPHYSGWFNTDQTASIEVNGKVFCSSFKEGILPPVFFAQPLPFEKLKV